MFRVLTRWPSASFSWFFFFVLILSHGFLRTFPVPLLSCSVVGIYGYLPVPARKVIGSLLSFHMTAGPGSMFFFLFFPSQFCLCSVIFLFLLWTK